MKGLQPTFGIAAYLDVNVQIVALQVGKAVISVCAKANAARRLQGVVMQSTHCKGPRVKGHRSSAHTEWQSETQPHP